MADESRRVFTSAASGHIGSAFEIIASDWDSSDEKRAAAKAWRTDLPNLRTLETQNSDD